VVNKRQNLNIWMNGLPIGQLSKSTSGAVHFQYQDAWLNTPGARPISLSMPLQRQAYTGEVVYNFFDNLLPDNRDLRDRIQSRFRATTSHPFDLLAAIGMDCVGAIQLVAEDETPQDVRLIRGNPLTDSQISDILTNFRSAPLGMTGSEDKDFRISIAGAQEKTALLWHEGRWHRPIGTTPTTHILKLPIGLIQHSGMDLTESCENEWLCLQIARAFGLPVCNAEIHSFEATKALVVERFDRRLGDGWIMRLPQEDLCQALAISPNLKYESDGGPGIQAILKFLIQSRESKSDRETFFKSQVVFWLLAAIDGHAKNYSIAIEPEGRFRLTPLYDIMSAFPLMAKRQLEAQKIKMAMALSGKNRHYHWHKIQPRHFVNTARLAGFNVKTAEYIIDQALDAVDEVIASTQAIMPDHFPSNTADAIFGGMLKQRDRFARAT
jgi:serine/threonine-protein kinase HipA